ncbi:MAG TPA: NAD-dependent dehydratase [Gammaproteobacteria bacterium]|nr:NAD-dependent dehydratase [Gammaproteobacteria bacterium]
MTTTLVTGATGFVGAAVVRQLLAADRAVRVLARPDSDRRNLQGLPVTVVEGDLREPAGLGPALRGCQVLYHVAADYRLWTPDPATLYETNVRGTEHLLLAAAEAGVERIVYTSSVATLGTTADGSPANEDTPATIQQMVGHYKRSKYLAEEAVTRLIRERGLPVVIVNPSTPVGPGDIKPTPTGRLVRDAAAGRIPAFVDTGLNIVHVDDVATGHLLAETRGMLGRRYVLGGEDLSLREILAIIAGLTGRPAPRIELPRAPLYPLAWLTETFARLRGGPEPQLTLDGLRMSRKRMWFSSARAEQELGYRARPARAALADAVAWFQRQG